MGIVQVDYHAMYGKKANIVMIMITLYSNICHVVFISKFSFTDVFIKISCYICGCLNMPYKNSKLNTQVKFYRFPENLLSCR